MACKVGSANPDIAGLGIIISFAFHAGLSLLLSIWSLCLWKPAIEALDRFKLEAFSTTPDEFAAQIAHQEEGLERSSENALTVLDQPQAGEDATQVPVPLKKKCIDKILATIGDVQIINAMGLLIAAFIQHETLSLYHLRVVYDIANFTAVSACASLINVSADANNPKRTRILVFSVYTLLFLPFCAFLGTKLKNWDEKVPGRCYNTGLTASPGSMHPLAGMIYLGITCFWSITALVCCFNSKLDPYRSTTFPTESFQRGVEQLKTYMLDSILRDIQSINQTRGGDYTGFFHWNPIFLVPQCFFTFLYLLFHPKAEYQVWALLPLAMAQYPLHLYMVIAIRIRNERFLEGDSENDWGFGQIIALVLCAATCIECIRGVSEYIRARESTPEPFSCLGILQTLVVLAC